MDVQYPGQTNVNNSRRPPPIQLFRPEPQELEEELKEIYSAIKRKCKDFGIHQIRIYSEDDKFKENFRIFCR